MQGSGKIKYKCIQTADSILAIVLLHSIMSFTPFQVISVFQHTNVSFINKFLVDWKLNQPAICFFIVTEECKSGSKIICDRVLK